jgi:hypothetical protein
VFDGEAAGDKSGYSVTMSSDGSRIAIGAIYNYGVNGIESGHVRIYDYNGTSWVQVGNDIDGEAASDYSGQSVTMSSDGTRIAIGAYGNGGNGHYSGHVRVYDYKVVNSPATGTVTISGDTTVGSTLTTTNTIADENGLGNFSYQWSSSDTSDGLYSNISGATSSTYTLVDTDVGKHMKVTFSYTDGVGYNESVTKCYFHVFPYIRVYKSIG